ncbi:MAG: restriction endonuclease subunit S [Desulfuromonadaceae bacterium]
MKCPLVEISQFCQTGSGGTPPRNNVGDYYGGDIPWVKSGELNEDIVLHTEERITELAIKESSAKMVPAGSILVAMYGATVGKTALLGIDAATNQAICNIIPKPEVADTRYVWYALKNQLPYLLAQRVGGAQPNISQQIIKKSKIALPPPSEQRRIVEILDKADQLRKLRAEADKKAARIFPALFSKMFGDPESNPCGWNKQPLFELVEIGTRLVDPNKSEYSELPHIGGEQIEKNSGVVLEYKTARESELRSSKFVFSEKHILFSKIRPNLNKVAFPRFKGLCSADVYPLLPKTSSISPWYLIAVLRSNAFLNFALTHSDRLRIPKLNKEQLGSFLLPVPDSNVMTVFDDQAENIDAMQTRRHKSREKIEVLFSILLSRAFSGNLTANWREAHMKELLAEMEQQAKYLNGN